MGNPGRRRSLVTDDVHRIATLPFDHTRRAMSALVDDGGDRRLVVKGAPEQVMANCTTAPASSRLRSARWTHCSPTVAAWWPSPASPRRT